VAKYTQAYYFDAGSSLFGMVMPKAGRVKSVTIVGAQGLQSKTYVYSGGTIPGNLPGTIGSANVRPVIAAAGFLATDTAMAVTIPCDYPILKNDQLTVDGTSGGFTSVCVSVEYP